MNHTLASSIILNTLKSHTFNTPTVDNYSTDHIFALRSNILAIQTLDIDTRDPSPFESTISVLQKAVYHPARVHRHESVGPFDLGPLWLGSFLTFAYHHSTRLAYIRHVCVVLRDTWPPQITGWPDRLSWCDLVGSNWAFTLIDGGCCGCRYVTVGNWVFRGDSVLKGSDV